MSGYNVTTPRLFNVKDPQTLVQFNLATLNSTFSFPDKQSTHSSGDTITADELLGGYVVVTGGDPDWFDDASNIISAIRHKMQGITNRDMFANGFSFKCIINNSSQNDLGFFSRNGTLVGGSTNQIVSGATGILEIVVNGQTALSTESAPQTDSVWVCISRCATAIANGPIL